MNIQILPSLLAADFGMLAQEISRVEHAGADALHIDVMDAHFVPNLSFGPDVVALSRRIEPTLYRNVHLMMTRPDLYLKQFIDAGAQTIQIHLEADCDVHAELARIRAMGVSAGLVINPETAVEDTFPYLQACDELLIMTVHPGYGGQSFISDCLPKIAAARSRAPHLNIMVDGGVNAETSVLAARFGANQFVAGSYLFKQTDMAASVSKMRTACREAFMN